jgi:hypothetical protein
MRPTTFIRNALHRLRRGFEGVLRVMVLACAFAPAAGASTFLDTHFGTPVGGASARSLALGSTGVSLHTGSEALFFNPAVLVPDARYGEVDLTVGVTQANEDRLVPLFDSFDSFVDETVVALNRNTYGTASGGAVWRVPGAWPMAIGAGVFERFDFDYDYTEEFRDPNSQNMPRDRILQNRELRVDGRLRTLSAGYAAEILTGVQTGASLHRWIGDVKAVERVQDFTNGRRRADSIEQDLEGWGWSVGAWGRVGDRIDLGASFEGPTTLDGDRSVVLRSGAGSQPDSVVTTASSPETEYPGVLRFGATYHPRNVLRTTFSIEMERRFWEQLDEPVIGIPGDTVQARDTWELRVGLEHVFYSGVPLRFGFRYLENYADAESERAIFSAGVGYRIAGFAVDVTGLYHRQTSRQEFLFDPSYLTFQAPNSREKVEDSMVQLILGVSRAF